MNVRSPRPALVGALALGLLAGAGGVAAAASTVFGADGTLYGCARQVQGALRLVEKGTNCLANEQAVQWNIQGPAGPAGPAGPPGPKGDPGSALENLDALEGMPCRIDDRSGEVAFTRFVPAPGAFALVGIYCMAADGYEPNDTRAAAADVASAVGPNGVLSLIGTTIHPAGDEDWFVVHGATFRRINVSIGLVVDVYRDGELVGDDLQAPAIIDDGASPHDWEIHVRSTGGPAPIIVQLTPF